MRRRNATLAALLLAMILCSCCTSTRPDATDAVREGVNAGGGSTKQTQAHLGLGGLAIAEDGNATGGATTRLGVDVQGAATGAANPVTIGPLAGSAGAAADLLRTPTPEEKLLSVRAARIQAALQRANEDHDLAPPEGKPALAARIAQLEGQESLAMARLADIHKEKLDAAAQLVPDLSKLERVWYSIYAPQIVTSGKAMTDAQTDAASAGFQAWIAAQKKAEAEAAAKPETPGEGG